MKKNSILMICFLLVLFGCTHVQEEQKNHDKLQVYTSFYMMYELANVIGKDKVAVYNMIPLGQGEPHDYEPTTQDMKDLSIADIFIYNGAGLEGWTQDVLTSVDNKQLLVVEASQGISLIKDGQKSDPHVWLDVENVKIQLKNVKDAFVMKDEQNKNYYEQNYEEYIKKLDLLHQEYKTTLQNVKHKELLVTHPAFSYLANAYGLKQIAVEGMHGEGETTIKDMQEAIDFIKKNQLTYIFQEAYTESKIAKQIESETQVTIYSLYTLESMDEDDQKNNDYISMMKKNLEVLKQVL